MNLQVARVVLACLALSIAAAAPTGWRRAFSDDTVQRTLEYDAEVGRLQKLEQELATLREENQAEAERQQEVRFEIGLARRLGPAIITEAGLRLTRHEKPDGLSFSVEARAIPLERVLKAIALSAGLKLDLEDRIPKESLDRRVNVALVDAPLGDAAEYVAGLEGLWTEMGEVRLMVGVPSSLAGGLVSRAAASRAFQAYQRGLVRFPAAANAQRAYCGLAQYYLVENQPEAAAQMLRTLLERHPESPERAEAFRILAEALKKMGDAEMARRAYLKYLDAFPDDSGAPEVMVAVAESYAANGEMLKAVETCGRLLERWPESPQACRAAVFRARTLAGIGEFARALEALRDVRARHGADLGADLPEVEFLTGMCLAKTGRVEESAAMLTGFLERYRSTPHAPEAYYAVGECLKDLKDYLGAARMFQKLIRSHPDHAKAGPAMLKLAECYRALDLPGMAGDSLRQYLDAQPKDAVQDDLVLQAARDMLDAGRVNASTQVLLRLSPSTDAWKAVEGRLLRCRGMLFQGLYPQAEKELLSVVDTANAAEQRDVALRMLGDCYTQMGRLDLAARAYMGLAEAEAGKGGREKDAATGDL